MPRPQPVPSAQPSTASSNVPDAKPPLATSFSNSPNVRNSTPRSPSRSVSSCDRPVSGVIPPYWQHTRNTSRTSQISREGGPPITLEDHTEDPNSDTSRGLWARSVTIDDHVVVHGKTGIGAYVVWYCVVQTLDVRQTFALVTDLYAPGSNGLLGWPYDDSHEVCAVSGCCRWARWLTRLGTRNLMTCVNGCGPHSPMRRAHCPLSHQRAFSVCLQTCSDDSCRLT